MNQVNYKADCNIDYKAWAAEYKVQEDKLKVQIDGLKAEFKNAKEKCTEGAHSLNKRINALNTLYREVKAARLILEERYAKYFVKNK